MQASESRVRVISKKILVQGWSTLTQYTYQYLRRDGQWQEQTREAYNRGNGVAILLYNLERRTVILIRQFRLATFVNLAEDGFLVEVPAGSLGDADPEQKMKEEVTEETGYQVDHIEKIFECYMSPGTVTEKLHFFAAQYLPDHLVSAGGGLEAEGEDIEVLEVNIDDAMKMIADGRIQDAKTILLLQHGMLKFFA